MGWADGQGAKCCRPGFMQGFLSHFLSYFFKVSGLIDMVQKDSCLDLKYTSYKKCTLFIPK